MPVDQSIESFYVGSWSPRVGAPWQVVAVEGSTVRVLLHLLRGTDPIPMSLSAFDRWRAATGAVKQ